MDKERRLAYEGILFTLCVALVLLWAIRVAESWNELRASIIVFLLGGVGAVLALMQFVLDLKASRRPGKKATGGISFDAPALASSSRWGSAEIWSWIVGFYIAIRLIGFPLAVPTFVFAYAKFYGATWFLAGILALAAWAAIYGMFELILHVPWPESILFSLVSDD